MGVSIKSFYVGQFLRSIDDKDRISLPQKWRNDDDSSLLALTNPLGCITFYPSQMIVHLQEKASNVSLGDTSGQLALMRLFSQAEILEHDSKGRIKVEKRLLQYAGVESEALLVGGCASFTLWNVCHFEDYISRQEKEDVFNTLKMLGL